MTSHTSETSSSEGIFEIPNTTETECVPVQFCQTESNGRNLCMVTANSKILLNDRDDGTDTAMNSDTEATVLRQTTDNTVGLLTKNNDTNTSTTSVLYMPKLKILKNLGIMCASFFLVFTSFHSLVNLQSSINKAEGVGTFSLVIVYIAMMCSSMFLSSVFIDRLGQKVTMCLAMVMYVVFMAANLYPVWGTMVPAALLCGLAAGPLWTSQSSFLSQLSNCYAKTTNTEPKDSISYFFGIFYMCFNASKISGNLLASIVLKKDDRSNRSMTQKEIEDCVANKQDAVNNATTLERPDDITIYLICGTWIGVAIIGIVVLFFLTPITTDGSTSKSRKRKSIFSKFLATANHCWNSKLQKLMILMPLYNGIAVGFLTADFTKSIVGCTFGIHTVGDFMLCHGICNTVSAALLGRLVKYFGHLPFFTIAFLCNAGVQISLVVWKPGTDYVYLLFTFAGMWGVADAIMKTQVVAMYGHLFTDNTEAAFGNYFVFEATGFIISFSYSTFVSTNIKLYILLGMLGCSATSYYTVEYIDRKRKARQDVDNDVKSTS